MGTRQSTIRTLTDEQIEILMTEHVDPLHDLAITDEATRQIHRRQARAHLEKPHSARTIADALGQAVEKIKRFRG